jgi:hypothetical protein
MSARESGYKFDVSATEWEAMHPGKLCHADRTRAKSAHTMANFHIRAVQTLNDHPDCAGTTAEHDDAILPKPKSTKRKRV